MTATSRRLVTLSFSGAGHLMPYHLGASKALLEEQCTIQAVTGSSAGALVATVLARMPRRLDEYADRFLQDRGRAMTHLESLLKEEELTPLANETPILEIATTRSENGKLHVFQFCSTSQQTTPDDHIPNKPYTLSKHDIEDTSLLTKAFRASCTIPKSFHPYDMFSKSSHLSYPDGIEIEGELYCDGGIVAPVPPISSAHPGATSIAISPISGPTAEKRYAIRPSDSTWSLPFSLTARCGTYKVQPSIQNFRALITSIGVGASTEHLKRWYSRGYEDAMQFSALLPRT